MEDCIDGPKGIRGGVKNSRFEVGNISPRLQNMSTEADYFEKTQKEILDFLTALGKRYEKYYEIVIENTEKNRVDFRIHKIGDPFLNMTGLKHEKLPNLNDSLFTVVITNLEFPLRYRQFLQLVLDKCVKVDEKSIVSLHPKYIESPILYARRSLPVTNPPPSVPLTEEILRLVQELARCKYSRHVGFMGLRSYETVAERMDNFLHVGQCDYVLKANSSQYGPSVQQLMSEGATPNMDFVVDKILASYGSGIKTVKIYVGDGKEKTVLANPRE